jgi:hypothetical protein
MLLATSRSQIGKARQLSVHDTPLSMVSRLLRELLGLSPKRESLWLVDTLKE